MPHSHRHDHGRLHRSLLADVGGANVHRLGRRRFLTEFGRRAFAVAILGGVAACSNDDTATDNTLDPANDDTATDDTLDAATVGSRWAQVRLGFVSAYVVVRGNTAAVVDTGTAGSADQIGSTLSILGVTFDDVNHVILTHSHPDHIGSLPEVVERASSAAVYAGRDDLDNIASPVEPTAVVDGDDVFGLQIIETPGHTPGSISALDGELGLLIAGDALNGDDDGAAVLGPDPDFTADMAAATASVAKLAALEFDIAVFGHGQPVEADAAALVRALT